ALAGTRYAVRAYVVARPGVFGAMALSYLASQYVPSGLISVMFGLAPLLSGLVMQALPGNVRLNAWHWAGCLTGVLGLAVVFLDGMAANSDMVIGTLFLLGAVSGFVVTGLFAQPYVHGRQPLRPPRA